jgi:hypothetical protein
MESLAINEKLEAFADQVAHYVYEINRAVRCCNGQSVGEPYLDVNEEKKVSLRNAVLLAWQAGSTLNNEESHNRWTYAKLREGWRLGPVEDATKKEHPNLIPYDELVWTEQLKDHLFQIVVAASEPMAEVILTEGEEEFATEGCGCECECKPMIMGGTDKFAGNVY